MSRKNIVFIDSRVSNISSLADSFGSDIQGFKRDLHGDQIYFAIDGRILASIAYFKA